MGLLTNTRFRDEYERRPQVSSLISVRHECMVRSDHFCENSHTESQQEDFPEKKRPQPFRVMGR